MINPFFKNAGPFDIQKLLKITGIENKEKFKNSKIYDVTNLGSATNKDLTFFHSKKYSELASKTNASYCVTLDNLSHFLPKKHFLLKKSQKKYPPKGRYLVNVLFNLSWCSSIETCSFNSNSCSLTITNSISNFLEVKSQSTKSMPEMTLQKEEPKVIVNIY